MNLFDPTGDFSQQGSVVQRKLVAQLETTILNGLTAALRDDEADSVGDNHNDDDSNSTSVEEQLSRLEVIIQEVACQDPFCAPLNTLFTILFPTPSVNAAASKNNSGHKKKSNKKEGCSYTFKILLPLSDCAQQQPSLILQQLPPASIVTKLLQGHKEYQLRFVVGTKVSCLIGRNPDTWAPGTIVEQWYQHPSWTKNLQAVPYKVKLVDGRSIVIPLDDPTCLQRDTKANQYASACC